MNAKEKILFNALLELIADDEATEASIPVDRQGLSKTERDAVDGEAKSLAYALCNGEHGCIPKKYMKDIAETAKPFFAAAVARARLHYIASRRPAELVFMEKCRVLLSGKARAEDAWNDAREAYEEMKEGD